MVSHITSQTLSVVFVFSALVWLCTPLALVQSDPPPFTAISTMENEPEIRHTRRETQLPVPRIMACDDGWVIPVDLEPPVDRQWLHNVGCTFIPVGFYRIDCHKSGGDLLYEMDTVHFLNVQNKVEIRYSPTMRAQLRHGEIVHAYGTGEENAGVFDEDDNEVAPLAIAECGRKRVHVRIPYFGSSTNLTGWITAGSWMVPVCFDCVRPFRPLSATFTMNSKGKTFVSWDPLDGLFVLEGKLNAGSQMLPEWALPVFISSAFQFTSAIGHLDLVRIFLPRLHVYHQLRAYPTPGLGGPSSSRTDFMAMNTLEETLRFGNGAHGRIIRLKYLRGTLGRLAPENSLQTPVLPVAYNDDAVWSDSLQVARMAMRSVLQRVIVDETQMRMIAMDEEFHHSVYASSSDEDPDQEDEIAMPELVARTSTEEDSDNENDTAGSETLETLR